MVARSKSESVDMQICRDYNEDMSVIQLGGFYSLFDIIEPMRKTAGLEINEYIRREAKDTDASLPQMDAASLRYYTMCVSNEGKGRET